MNKILPIAIACLALTFVIAMALPFNMVAAEGTADQACENQIEREQRCDVKTEPDSPSPSNGKASPQLF